MRYILVVGTGRSGTSTTARILHQRLDVCMGHTFLQASGLKKTRNPQGFWEEIGGGMTGVTKQLIKGMVSVEQWHEQLDATHDRHGCKSKLRGYKHPRLAEIASEDIWAALDPLLVIKTWRPRELVLRSMIFASPHDVTGCVDRFTLRKENMEKYLRGIRTFVMRFERHLSDKEVWKTLRPQIEALR